MDQNPTILKSTRLARAQGVNTLLFLKTAMVNMVQGVCEAFLNTRYFIRQTDGTNVLPALEADVVTTEMGRTVTFPPITTPPFTQVPGMHPFRIYKPNPLPPDGFNYAYTFDSDGNYFKAKIDSTNPTNFLSSPPTVNPTTDAWRFWQVRSGEVEVRPYYSIVSLDYWWGGLTNGALRTIDPSLTDDVFPFEESYPYRQYDDPATDSETVLIIPNITGTYDSNDAIDYVGNILFSIWVEIIPDTSSDEDMQIILKGNRFSIPANMGDEVGGTDPFTPFPASSPFVIPIGIIGSAGASYIGSTNPYNLLVEQIVSANIINRWPPGMFGGNIDSYGSIPGQLCYRGDWTIDDIHDQVFYPGDIVRVRNTITGTDTISYQALQFTGTPYGGTRNCLYTYILFMAQAICFTSDPTADSNFLCISSCGTLVSF